MSLTRTNTLTQVHEECAALCRATHLRVVGLHGGQPMVTEVLAMRKGFGGGGADILVATPGRLLDHVEVGALGCVQK
jgi:superfamily II DNA/RNA helicase